MLNSSQNVHILNLEKFNAKLQGIKNDGIKELHFISDFDMTLTKAYLNTPDEGPAVRAPTSHAIFNSSSITPSNVKAETQKLFEQFYPIEISSSISRSEKIPHMIEWWQKSHDLILNMKLTPDNLNQMITDTPLTFREGVSQFLGLCDTNDIPVLVFSAGLGDIIQRVLKSQNLLKSNVHLVSNFMSFSEGVATSFSYPLIHVFNKNEASLTPTYKDLVMHRKNCILIGDSLGDLEMATGVKHQKVLTFGFLNHKKEELLERYMEAFDVVFTGGDVGFDGVVEILKAVIDNNKSNK